MIKHDFLAVCNGKLHCTLCRNKGKGRRFREHVIQHLIETLEVNFACPQGFEWEAKIEPDFMPALSKSEGPQKSPAPAIENIELSKTRFEFCKICDNSKDKGFHCELHKGCCFGRWRTQPMSQCPDSPPKWLAFKPEETALHTP